MNQETKMHEEQRKILDSGNRREFESGAVRDIAEGKGRCDLLPLVITGEFLLATNRDDPRYKSVCSILDQIEDFIRGGNFRRIYSAIIIFCNTVEWSPITAILEVSKHYEEGAKKYDERNWEKGIPCHCYIDSGVRHLLKWLEGWDDEPHDRAFIWNMLGLLWTACNKPDLNDLPYAEAKTQEVSVYDVPKI